MTTTLRWPDGRGRFRDHDSSRVAGVVGVDDTPLEVAPGDTVDVSDPNAVDHYLDRGFQAVDDADSDGADDADGDQDGSGGDDDSDESQDSDDFDVDGFLDRTPVAQVVDDIEAGDADGHLDAVATAADRVTVERAVDDRKDAIGGD